LEERSHRETLRSREVRQGRQQGSSSENSEHETKGKREWFNWSTVEAISRIKDREGRHRKV